MPVRALFLQEEIRCSARIHAVADSGKEATSATENDTNDVARSTIEEITHAQPQRRWLRAWSAILLVYRKQLIRIEALQRYPEQGAALAGELPRGRVVEGGKHLIQDVVRYGTLHHQSQHAASWRPVHDCLAIGSPRCIVDSLP